ncbi:hypothetical protein JCM5353_009037 [Sporobolomyces roseus]
MASFVGLPVLLKLKGDQNHTAQGIVLEVDGARGTIVLADAQIITQNGSRIERRAVFEKSEVAGLELLAVKKPEPTPVPESVRQAPVLPRAPSQQQQHRQLTPWSAEEPQSLPQHNYSPLVHAQRLPPAVQAYTHSPQPSPSPQSSPKPPGTPRSQRQRGARETGRRARAEWDGVEAGDEADLRNTHSTQPQYSSPPNAQGESFDEEFDFQGGLQSFDKSAVFAHIRSTDNIDPSLRLVAHNRNPRTSQSKLLPTESVLTVEELEQQQMDRQAAMEAVPVKQRGMTVEELEAGVASVGLAQEEERGYEYEERGSTLATESGIVVPTVKLRQWKEALGIADIETSPSPSQRLELAAYQLTTFILTHLSQKFALFPLPSPPQSRPSVLLLCTDCEKANVALRCGILLANRGCRVIALVDDARSEDFKTNLRVLSSSGGRIVRDVADLPPTFNLVIDALADSETSLPPSLSSSPNGVSPASPAIGSKSTFSPSSFAAEAANFTNHLNSGVLSISIDLPYGISHDDGSALSSVFLNPTFIFSRALPRPGAVALLSESANSPQLFVADIGFAPSVWERIGVDGFEVSTWGAEGIVRVALS